MMRVLAPFAAALALALPGAVQAQAYPSKPVKVIVPFAPGGNLDVTARLVAENMARQLGQPFVVENRPGAGGAVGSEVVAKSPPDGYTLVVGTTATTIVSPLLIPQPPYRPQDFAGVGTITGTPHVVAVPAASPHGDLKALLATARASPGKVSVAHAGNGTTNHIATLLLQDATKVAFNVIPYKGSGPAIIDAVGGQVDALVDQTSSSLPQIRGGKLKALAVSTPARIPDLPGVPTLREQGVALEVLTTSVLLAPAKTPPEVVKVLNAALNKALADAEVSRKLAELGSQVRPVTPEQFAAILKEEEAKMNALVASGLLKGQ